MTFIKNKAAAVVARVNELGFTKNGKPMVIDQGYELVAAAYGFRNQHAMRASELKAAPPQDTSASNATWASLVSKCNWTMASQVSLMTDFLKDNGLWDNFVSQLELPAPLVSTSVAIAEHLRSYAYYSFYLGSLSFDELLDELAERKVECDSNVSSEIRSVLLDWYSTACRNVADQAFENFNFSELGYLVEAFNGWETIGESSFNRVVFLHLEHHHEGDSIRAVFRCEASPLGVIDHSLVF